MCGYVPTRLTMTGVKKAFGATVALDGVDFSVAPGEVHALIGENGAGKSTLMKTLAGVHQPDAGGMQLDGVAYAPADPLDARRQGVAMIFQELALAPHLSVEANVVLGVEPASGLRLDTASARAKTREALAALGHSEIDPAARVSELSIAAQQLVEIARALILDAKIIVLDEPTSSLTGADVDKLFEAIERLKARGVSIIYISHFLEEVERIADSFTVLRDGRSVGSGVIGEVSIDRIVEWMVGRSVAEMFPRTPHDIGEPVLEVSDLAADNGLERGSLVLRRGEILGLAGLIGAGRTEMLRALFGLDAITSGRVRLGAFEGPAAPPERLRQGMGFLSEDRKSEGLALALSVEQNLTLSRLDPFVRRGWLSPVKARAAAERWIEQVGVKTAGPDAPVGSLSGGNQQKVQLARLLHHDCDVLLLDEPTRGIDVASKVVIYEWIGRLAAQGKAILFVSSYIPELLGVCDSLAVMHRGRLGPVRPIAEWDQHKILLAAAAGQPEAA
ncbi:MAG: ATP-binding cassette domain-containing protein [Acidobacteria bacterium]|nr:ATP-binding cassette domain-containing protein [Acidobacteriota bacterium]